MTGFHVRTNLLKRWLRTLIAAPPADRRELNAGIAKVKEIAGREKHPAQVSSAEGWSPHLACSFLVTEGLSPGDYPPDALDETQWFASSPYLEIGEAILPDNLAYYVEGNEHVANRLKLWANFNDPQSRGMTLVRFAGVAARLLREAFGRDAPSDLLAGAAAGTPAAFEIDGKRVEISREDWPVGRGFTLRLTIRAEARPSADLVLVAGPSHPSVRLCPRPGLLTPTGL